MLALAAQSPARGGEPLDLPWADGQLEKLVLPSGSPEPWRFTDFPILAWLAPPASASPEDFRAYREAGFNLHPTHPDDGFHQALDRLSQAGLYSIPFRQSPETGVPAAEIDFEQERQRKSIVGWIASHQPTSIDQTVAAVREVGRLMQEDPTRWAFLTLPPARRFDQPSLEAVVRAGLRAGMPVLSSGYYQSGERNGRIGTQEHFNNLEALRRLSLEHDIPFWASALAVEPKGFREPSESQLRWKLFTSLAYGAKGLCYFSYWGATGDGGEQVPGVVDPVTGRPGPLYPHVKAINQEVARVGNVLLKLTNLDVVHTSPPEGHRPFQKGMFWIEAVEGEDLLVSFFQDEAGRRYAMVVNKRQGLGKSAADMTDRVTLTFGVDVTGVEVVSWIDGAPGELELQGQSAILDIAGGTGLLLRATP